MQFIQKRKHIKKKKNTIYREKKSSGKEEVEEFFVLFFSFLFALLEKKRKRSKDNHHVPAPIDESRDMMIPAWPSATSTAEKKTRSRTTGLTRPLRPRRTSCR